MKNRRLWILLVGIFVIGGAFLFLNFHAAVSSTQTGRNTNKIGLGEGMPFAMQRRDKISLALVGDDPLVEALQKALKAELQAAGLGEIELVQDLEPLYPNPVLVVQVGKPALLWTPFYATSQFSVQAGYSSYGDTTLMGDTLATVDDKNGPVLTLYGTYSVSDRSWGLISHPGYRQILADALSREIVAGLKDLYQVSS